MTFWSGHSGLVLMVCRVPLSARFAGNDRDTSHTVSDSLDHSPERCTVVASYKRLVVGVAILSSPQETYITYLAVKAGWDNAQIARFVPHYIPSETPRHILSRSMLYHLINLNPNKDITLHVSVNNSAMACLFMRMKNIHSHLYPLAFVQSLWV